MIKKVGISFLVLLFSLNLTGCASKQDMGTVTGAVAGGLLGSTLGQGSGKMLAIGVGTVAGALVGNAIGKSMDDVDRMKMNNALEHNNLGQPAYWRNNNTGADYRVVPVKNVTVDGNQYCREYRSVANIGGKKQQVYGTACRQPDGSWQIVN